MKKLLVVLLLVTAVYAMAQDQPAAAAQPAPQKKVIQDPAEYNAYVAAIGSKPGAEREAALEAFLTSYPKSVMKEDALEALLKDYQGTGPLPKFNDAGKRLLEANPNNVTGLFLVSYVDRAVASPILESKPTDPDALKTMADAGQLSARGLQLLPTAAKPEGFTDDQWNKMKDAFKPVFTAVVGHSAFLAKDYPTAQQNLKAAVDANPTDLQNVYLLARAYLDPKPPVVDGLFWIARASALAPAGVKESLAKYAKNKYIRYHGDEDGFDKVVAAAASSSTLPAGFAVTPAPTPAEQADGMLKKTPPEKLSFGEWEFIMTSGNQAASDQVWNAIKGKMVKMQGWIVGDATSKEVKLAGTEDAKNAGTADITLALATPLLPKQLAMLKPGQLMTFSGVPDANTPNPFVLTMIEGKLDLPEAPKAKPSPAHHPAAKKK